jgi:hypothetical protein
MLAIAIAGVVVASVYTASLDDRQPASSPAAATALRSVRDAAFATPDVTGLDRAEVTAVRSAFDAASDSALDAVAALAVALCLLAALTAAIGLRTPGRGVPVGAGDAAGSTAA